MTQHTMNCSGNDQTINAVQGDTIFCNWIYQDGDGSGAASSTQNANIPDGNLPPEFLQDITLTHWNETGGTFFYNSSPAASIFTVNTVGTFTIKTCTVVDGSGITAFGTTTINVTAGPKTETITLTAGHTYVVATSSNSYISSVSQSGNTLTVVHTGDFDLIDMGKGTSSDNARVMIVKPAGVYTPSNFT